MLSLQRLTHFVVFVQHHCQWWPQLQTQHSYCCILQVKQTFMEQLWHHHCNQSVCLLRLLASCLNYAWKLHVLIADWSVAHFGVIMNDVMNDNMAAFAHVGAHLGALLLDQIFRLQCTVRQYTTLIYLINLLGKLVLGLGLDSELHYFSIFTENKKNEHFIFCECHDVNLVLKERTHMRLCISMLIFTHNLGNWLIILTTLLHDYKGQTGIISQT